ncbi:hypothetical protein CGCF415_v012805 [Colletotrichum fructicola]|uniref:uncharacterized protein n=1 Tax=Colletotrichum aenigma TaxID=1215731 RepID=UPI001872E843|nr:uncharacterized protein CGCA056_v008477 [Colletotrichum aenigma]KAF4885593.1 hypothetical protein CGCFRS4_v011864 [Colletotrichum fructicola]KAF4893161.1 hypothetical protein CGCF415_v012805 [Colletotrichum fructicola]KAF4927857.1 hypothetical protein CGCF245_v012984 [Colletotrichum fructicola]KAF5496065.1 hypothetical protein CGCF413_v008703 [Colletotrichum fructicola]KAF5519834.1 hypothetical protein CGCA056_v008477 [Colletotrichum aenigma]
MHHAFGSGGVENPDKPEVYSRPLVDGVGPEALVQTRVLTVTEIDWHHKRAVYRIGTAARVRPCKHSRQRDTGDGLLMNGNAQVLESH